MADVETSKKFTREHILHVHQWPSPGLVSIRLTRDPQFQFAPGQFARIGLPQSEEPDKANEPDLWRAYSMVSHPQDDFLEFLSITVPNGQLSPRLAQLQAGDPLWVEKTPFGFLTLDRFSPAQSLWLVATGTGLSAYMPMLRDERTWRDFETVILVHGVRAETELAYAPELHALTLNNSKFVYLPILSRQPWNHGQEAPCRLTHAYETGILERVAGHKLDPAQSRIMLCGNPEMVTDMRALLSLHGFAAGRRGNLGNLAVENYW